MAQTMNIALVTWILVVAVTIVTTVYTAFNSGAKRRTKRSGKPIRKFIEFGRESEEFFIPGDNADGDINEAEK